MSMWRCVYRRGCAPTKCTRRHSSRILLGLWRWRLHFIECLKSDGVLECSDSNQRTAAESDGRDGAPRKEKQRRYVSSLFWRCKCLLKPLWQLLCGRIRRCGRRRRRGAGRRHGRRRDKSCRTRRLHRVLDGPSTFDSQTWLPRRRCLSASPPPPIRTRMLTACGCRAQPPDNHTVFHSQRSWIVIGARLAGIRALLWKRGASLHRARQYQARQLGLGLTISI